MKYMKFIAVAIVGLLKDSRATSDDYIQPYPDLEYPSYLQYDNVVYYDYYEAPQYNQ